MSNNDILGTQNWKQSQSDPFLAQKIAIFGKYLYVDNVDEIFIRIQIFANMRIIRINRINSKKKSSFLDQNFVILDS